jgi:hypothetical protein
MTKSAARPWHHVVRDTRGTEIAETAVVLPMLFMILIAIFWFGQAFRIYTTLTQASRAGARAAVAPVCATCPPAGPTSQAVNAQAAVQNTMAAAHLSVNQLVPTAQWTPPALYACGIGTTTPVACDGSVTIPICVQERVQLSLPTTAPGGMGTCGTSVSMHYKYPFHFRIPLTNLDLGTMQLPGQAQMRAETQ